MGRQALHDAVVRDNVQGLARLHEPPKEGHRHRVLSDEESAMLKKVVLAGPDLARSSRSAWTLPSLAEEIARLWDRRLQPTSLSWVLRRPGLSNQKTRPHYQQANAEAQEAVKERLAETLS